MLHLFNKVYISNDTIIDTNTDRYVISKDNGFNILEPLDKISYGKLLGYGQTIDEILKKTDFSRLISSMKSHCDDNDRKIIIYTDDEAFIEFMSLWYKSIFKNPTVASAWYILNTYLTKEKLLKSSKNASTAAYIDIYRDVTETKFQQSFLKNDVTVLNKRVYETIKDQLSFEILLAGYIANGSNKEQLKKSVRTILTRALKEIVLEIKHAYIRNGNRVSFPSYAKDSEFFSQSSLYLKEELGLVSDSYLSVDIRNASDLDIEKFKRIAKGLLVDWDQFQQGSDVIKLIDFIDMVRQDDLSDSDLDAIIEFEKNAKGVNRIFSSADEEKINVYFLDYVLSSAEKDLLNYVTK